MNTPSVNCQAANSSLWWRLKTHFGTSQCIPMGSWRLTLHLTLGVFTPLGYVAFFGISFILFRIMFFSVMLILLIIFYTRGVWPTLEFFLFTERWLIIINFLIVYVCGLAHFLLRNQNIHTVDTEFSVTNFFCLHFSEHAQWGLPVMSDILVKIFVDISCNICGLFLLWCTS